jgi:uncharacterized protein
MNTFSWLNKKTTVSKTKYGFGIFSKDLIKRGDVIAVFGGYILNLSDLDKMDKNIKDWGLQISEDLILGYISKEQKEDVIFFNHSCNPNAGFNGQLFLTAIKNIKKGEEITFDYGMALFSKKTKPDYIMNCLCKSKKCRKIVTSNDWKLPDLQKRYNGYFQWFLQEKINKL